MTAGVNLLDTACECRDCELYHWSVINGSVCNWLQHASCPAGEEDSVSETCASSMTVMFVSAQSTSSAVDLVLWTDVLLYYFPVLRLSWW